MKKNIILTLMIITALPIFAQQKVYVFAYGGLNLRETPSIESKIIEKLNFGDTLAVIKKIKIFCPPVQIFKKDKERDEDDINFITDDLILTGKWLKVKYKGKIGYVNDVYVSSFPNTVAMQRHYGSLSNDNISADTLGESTFHMLNQFYGISKSSSQLSKKALHYKLSKDKDGFINTTFYKKYKDGLKYQYSDQFDEDMGIGGYAITLTKKGLTFNEAIMICLSRFDNSQKTGFEYNKKSKKYILSHYMEGGACTGAVYQQKNGDWVIEFGCGGC